MDGYDASTYGERWADVYDDWFPDVTDTEACVARLAELAGPPATAGAVLELGVGTGRLAVPLAALGYDVRGIDASPAMLARLAAKPGAAVVATALGDMADVALPPRPGDAGVACRLVFVAYNTFFNLTDPTAQERCLAGVAALLAPGGRFVVEAFVPAADATGGGAARSNVTVRTLAADRLVLAADVVDPDRQVVRGQYVDITEGGIRLRPFEVHYLRPDQLDERCAAAGLALEARWADWHGTPLSADDATHVSVYRSPG